jgi:hypothetical protein
VVSWRSVLAIIEGEPDRSAYVDVAAPDLDPRELAELLERVLSTEALTPAREPSDTLVVEVHGFARLGSDPERGALLVTLGEGRRRRPLVVEHLCRHCRSVVRALPAPHLTLH